MQSSPYGNQPVIRKEHPELDDEIHPAKRACRRKAEDVDEIVGRLLSKIQQIWTLDNRFQASLIARKVISLSGALDSSLRDAFLETDPLKQIEKPDLVEMEVDQVEILSVINHERGLIKKRNLHPLLKSAIQAHRLSFVREVLSSEGNEVTDTLKTILAEETFNGFEDPEMIKLLLSKLDSSDDMPSFHLSKFFEVAFETLDNDLFQELLIKCSDEAAVEVLGNLSKKSRYFENQRWKFFVQLFEKTVNQALSVCCGGVVIEVFDRFLIKNLFNKINEIDFKRETVVKHISPIAVDYYFGKDVRSFNEEGCSIGALKRLSYFFMTFNIAPKEALAHNCSLLFWSWFYRKELPDVFEFVVLFKEMQKENFLLVIDYQLEKLFRLVDLEKDIKNNYCDLLHFFSEMGLDYNELHNGEPLFVHFCSAFSKVPFSIKKNHEEIFIELFNLLEELGIDLKRSSQSPLKLAANWGSSLIFNYLLKKDSRYLFENNQEAIVMQASFTSFDYTTKQSLFKSMDQNLLTHEQKCQIYEKCLLDREFSFCQELMFWGIPMAEVVTAEKIPLMIALFKKGLIERAKEIMDTRPLKEWYTNFNGLGILTTALIYAAPKQMMTVFEKVFQHEDLPDIPLSDISGPYLYCLYNYPNMIPLLFSISQDLNRNKGAPVEFFKEICKKTLSDNADILGSTSVYIVDNEHYHTYKHYESLTDEDYKVMGELDLKKEFELVLKSIPQAIEEDSKIKKGLDNVVDSIISRKHTLPSLPSSRDECNKVYFEMKCRLQKALYLSKTAPERMVYDPEQANSLFLSIGEAGLHCPGAWQNAIQERLMFLAETPPSLRERIQLELMKWRFFLLESFAPKINNSNVAYEVHSGAALINAFIKKLGIHQAIKQDERLKKFSHAQLQICENEFLLEYTAENIFEYIYYRLHHPSKEDVDLFDKGVIANWIGENYSKDWLKPRYNELMPTEIVWQEVLQVLNTAVSQELLPNLVWQCFREHIKKVSPGSYCNPDDMKDDDDDDTILLNPKPIHECILRAVKNKNQKSDVELCELLKELFYNALEKQRCLDFISIAVYQPNGFLVKKYVWQMFVDMKILKVLV